MIARFIRILIAPVFISAAPLSLLAQHAIPNHSPLGSTLRPIEKQTWHVFGKVTDVRGEPLRAASVRVDLGSGSQYVQSLTTDLQGRFRTEYNLDAQLFKRLPVDLLVEREGYRTAHEFVDFGSSDKTWEIDVVMRAASEGAEELAAEALVNALAPRLRASLESDASLKPVRKDLQRAIEEFLDKHDSRKSIPSFDKVVGREPDCANCRTLMGLALLDAGSWSSASRQFGEAARRLSEEGSAPQKADSLLILAALENWKGEYRKAAGFLMQAKDLDPKSALVLQELGRTLVFQENWQAAEEYLRKALDAGASREASLLRARALLEEGDPEAADAEMKKYLDGESVRGFPVSVRALYTQIETRMDLRTYAKVKSVVSEPIPSLVKAFPELRGLEPASNPSDLGPILEKTGRGVQSFFRNFPNTTSIEQVREEHLGKNGKMKDALDQKFQYLLLTRPEKWGLGLEEFRTNNRGERTAPAGLNAGFMLTSGFASASLLFHPAYQSGASFRHLGRQLVEGRRCHVVAFAQDPGKAQMVESFTADQDRVLVLFQGLAWVDGDTYRIIRLRTDLLKPQSQIRLQRQTTEIKYEPVEFKQVAATMWLPSEVAVTVNWKGKTYRNLHKYSGFRVFHTETKEKRGLRELAEDLSAETAPPQTSQTAPPGTPAPQESAPPPENPPPANAAQAVPPTPEDASSVSIVSEPAGADVTIDGKFVGDTPSTVRLAPGDHAVTIEKAGFTRWQRTLSVDPGGSLTIDAALEKIP